MSTALDLPDPALVQYGCRCGWTGSTYDTRTARPGLVAAVNREATRHDTICPWRHL